MARYLLPYPASVSSAEVAPAWRTEAAQAFLPVRVVDREAGAPRLALPIEIVLPTGPTVRVPTGFNPRTLGHVLAVLEGRLLQVAHAAVRRDVRADAAVGHHPH
jgi:hypothetical protein